MFGWIFFNVVKIKLHKQQSNWPLKIFFNFFLVGGTSYNMLNANILSLKKYNIQGSIRKLVFHVLKPFYWKN